MEDGSVSYPESGSPQGGVISPMLSNVFLHYVLDLWFEQDVKPRLRRDAYLIRYADDFVIGFRDHRDAQRVMDVVPKRFGKYGLTVHPTKTSSCLFVHRLRLFGEYHALIVLVRLTFWGSPITGPDPGEVTGSSNSRQHPTASVVRCGASTDGAGNTGTGRSKTSNRS